MGEEAPEEYDLDMYGGGGGGEEERVMEWEAGLPGADELTPLSQPLVPAGLAAAFRIPPEPGRTLLDVHRASAATFSRLRRASSSSSSSATSFPAFNPDEAESAAGGAATAAAEGGNNTNNGGGKKARLVWTPQLHKRFVEVVAHLGMKNAVPKTIMQLMNVEGLTRENVASHLQKYRLYVKRMQGLSNEGPSPSDHIFASTPVPLLHDHVPNAYASSNSYHHHHQAHMYAHAVSSSYAHHYHHADK